MGHQRADLRNGRLDFIKMASASPEASAQPVNNRVQAQLKIFHLALLDHPCLLLCTRIGCEHGVVLVPTLKDVVLHLSKHRVPLAASGRDFFQEMLEEFPLDHPSAASINMRLLPAPKIPGIEVCYDGFYCCLCGYTIKLRSTGFKPLTTHSASPRIENSRPFHNLGKREWADTRRASAWRPGKYRPASFARSGDWLLRRLLAATPSGSLIVRMAAVHASPIRFAVK
ncbi:transcription initiation factor TFIID, subunit TAF12 [Moesziomyces antarcticus T-34]|uniref:Transcription initiation factor TFIID, subunit TAF12 n=1 Tax=Pseudozyma antarctica (strain T-34) TaxID=1151754 RepID=M9LXD4_PSEA3|nr:transcription initiation factor TFIID, subunit TAF12 [Moesziomyces antarcticus T-34]